MGSPSMIEVGDVSEGASAFPLSRSVATSLDKCCKPRVLQKDIDSFLKLSFVKQNMRNCKSNIAALPSQIRGDLAALDDVIALFILLV